MNITGMIKKLFNDIRYRKLKEQRLIATTIKEFYLDKFYIGDYDEAMVKAITHISDLGITQLRIKEKAITIVLRRPGLLIGQHGCNIISLENYLRKKLGCTKINIKEDKVIDFLFY